MSLVYPLWVQFDVLHRLRLSKQNHLLNDVHLIIGIDGLVQLSVIYKTRLVSKMTLKTHKSAFHRRSP